jgi:hypothetical protein
MNGMNGMNINPTMYYYVSIHNRNHNECVVYFIFRPLRVSH